LDIYFGVLSASARLSVCNSVGFSDLKMDADFKRNVCLDKATAEQVYETIACDISFLAEHKSVDYFLSLVVKKAKTTGTTPPPSPSSTVKTDDSSSDADCGSSTTSSEPQKPPSLPQKPVPQQLRIQKGTTNKVCFVEETFQPRLQHVPKRLTSSMSERDKGKMTSSTSSTLSSSSSSSSGGGSSTAGKKKESSTASDEGEGKGADSDKESKKEGESTEDQIPIIGHPELKEEYLPIEYIFVIDGILNQYNTGKKIEGLWSSLRMKKTLENSTSLSPDAYALRFRNMADSLLLRSASSAPGTTSQTPPPSIRVSVSDSQKKKK